MLKNRLAQLVSLVLVCGGAYASQSVKSDDSYSLRDVGVINEERIVYWLTKRGELAYDATEQEKRQAVAQFTRNSTAHSLPKSIQHLEGQAQKRAEKSEFKSRKNANKTVKVFSVLIDFPNLRYNNNGLSSGDTAMYYADYNVAHYQDLQFSTTGYEGPSGQNLMSGYQFYQAESGNSFFFTGETFGWVTADNNAAHYGGNDPDNNDNDLAVPDLVTEAVNKAFTANPNLNLDDYDIEDPYDRDGDGDLNEPDGFIDHVMIYHSSIGEEAGGGNLGDDAIWSHRFVVNSTGNFNTMGAAIGSSGKRVFGYTVQPIDAAAGVVVHEFGHDLGLPDFYDTTYEGNGSPVAMWSVMASGSWAGSPSGTQPVGFSPYGREYLQNKFGGDWIDQVEVDFFELNNGDQTHDLVQATDHTSPINQIRVNVPGPIEPFSNPYTGVYQYYSGQGHDLTNKMQFELSLPSASSISMTMKAHWDIEKDWDLVMIKVNGNPIPGNYTTAVNPYTGQYALYSDVAHYLSDKSSLISGAEGSEGWVGLAYDLSSFSGQVITVEFEYRTDSNTGGYGFAADDIEVMADGSQVAFDGAETENATTLLGFQRATNSYTGIAQNYYIQLRSHNSVDAGLATRSYQRGVVLWLRNDAYSDNDSSEHPGYGLLSVIDANLTTSSGSNTTQLRDAAFTQTGQSLFRDTTDYSKPASPETGVVLVANGLEMEVLSQASDSSSTSVNIRKVALPLSSSFSYSFTNTTVSFVNTTLGGDGAKNYLWNFGDGNESTDVQPTHTYAAEGVYSVTLTATDESSNVHSVTQEVVVGTLPSAQFTTSINNLTVTITNSSTGGFGTATYSWSFGDGNSSSTSAPTHTYASAGTYTIVLTMTDSLGNTSTSSRSVTVTAPSSGGGGGSLSFLTLLALLGLSKRKWK